MTDLKLKFKNQEIWIKLYTASDLLCFAIRFLQEKNFFKGSLNSRCSVLTEICDPDLQSMPKLLWDPRNLQIPKAEKLWEDFVSYIL